MKMEPIEGSESQLLEPRRRGITQKKTYYIPVVPVVLEHYGL